MKFATVFAALLSTASAFTTQVRCVAVAAVAVGSRRLKNYQWVVVLRSDGTEKNTRINYQYSKMIADTMQCNTIQHNTLFLFELFASLPFPLPRCTVLYICSCVYVFACVF